MSDVLKEAKKLYDLGLAVIWIKPWNGGGKAAGKAPMGGEGWQKGPRKTWEELRRTYVKDAGVGVRLGEPGKMKGGYLINIDIDVKSQEKHHQFEAEAEFEKLFPGSSIKDFPVIKTGRGLRVLALTQEPVPSQNLARSEDLCKIMTAESEIPDSQLAYVERGLIKKSELKAGYRIRPAWELDLLSTGKQGVFPPSIHPGSKKPYSWLYPIRGSIGLLVPPSVKPSKKHLRDDTLSTVLSGWKPEAIDLEISALSEDAIAAIRSGVGVSDRSAALLSAALSMVRAGFSETEMLSVLTDKNNYLGSVGYERRGNSRNKAAEWILRYVIRPALAETKASHVFDDVPEDDVKLTDEGRAKQHSDIARDISSKPWQSSLKLTDKGKPKNSLFNTIVALSGLIGEKTFAYDEFLCASIFTKQNHFGAEKERINDVHLINMKAYLAKTGDFEPAVSIVYEAVCHLAHRNVINPAKDFFLSLPPFDGESIIDGWMHKNFKAQGDKGYVDEVFRLWLVAAVTRVFQPGHKFDWMLVLESKQGFGKSIFGEILFGEEFFVDSLPSLENKMPDAVQQIQGKLCVEMSELSELKKNQIETVKAFLTRKRDSVRFAYDRMKQELPRRCIFYGTTNKKRYLQDDENRRFNPIRVGWLDVAALKRDRLKIWAEAYFLYANGLVDSLYLSPKSTEIAVSEREERRIPSETDHIETVIREMMHDQPEFFMKPDGVRVNELFMTGVLANASIRNDRFGQMRVSDVLLKLGAERKKREGIRRYYFKREDLIQNWDENNFLN